MRKKKLWNKYLKRCLALALSVAMVGSDVIPSMAMEQKTSYLLGSDITEEQMREVLEEESEKYPEGRFEFFVSQIDTQEGGQREQLLIVRRGGTDSEATVDFKAVDVTATYGEDYRISVETTKKKTQTLGEDDKTGGSIKVGDFQVKEEGEEAESLEPLEVTESTPEEVTEVTVNEPVVNQRKVSNGTSLQVARDTYLGTESSNLNWQQLDEAETVEEEKKDAEYKESYNDFAKNVEGFSHTFTFKKGECMKSVYIDIIDDNLSESEEQAMFLLSNASAGEVSGVTTGYLNIKDNDEEEQVIFAMDTDHITVDREAGKAEIVINRVSGINMMAGVTVGTGGQTAKPDVDYQSVKKEIFFAQGVTSQTVEIPLLDYAGAPKEATFQVALDANNAYVQEDCAITTVTLTDDKEEVTQQEALPENVAAEGAGELVPAVSEGSDMSADAATEWVDSRNVNISAEVSGREDSWSGRKDIWTGIDLTTASKIEIHWKSDEGSYKRSFWYTTKYTRDTYLYLNGKQIMYRWGEHTGWQTYSYTLTDADKVSGSYLQLETKTYGGNKNAISRVDWVKVYYPGYQFTINNGEYTDGQYSNVYVEKIFCDDAEAKLTTADKKHRYKNGNKYTLGQAKVIKNGDAGTKGDSVVVHRAATDSVTIVNDYNTGNKNSNGVAISSGVHGNVYLAGYQLKQPNSKSWSDLILPEDVKFTKDFVNTYRGYLHSGNEFIIRPVYRPYEARVMFQNPDTNKGSYANGFGKDDVLRCTMFDTIQVTAVSNKGYSVAGFSIGAHKDGWVHLNGTSERTLAERANNYYNQSDGTMKSEAVRVSGAGYVKGAVNNATQEGAIKNRISFTPTGEFVYICPVYSTPSVEVLIDPKNNYKDKGEVIYSEDGGSGIKSGNYKTPLLLSGVTLNKEYTLNAITKDGYKAYFKNFTGDADKNGIISTAEEATLKKYNYNFVREANNGNAYTFRPVMDYSLIYYGFDPKVENRYAGYIDGVVTVKDKTIFGNKTKTVAVNGAQVSVSGKTVGTKTDDKYGGIDGKGGDGYFSISDRDFVAGENKTINISYNNVTLTATQAVNAAGIYELDAYDGIGVCQAKAYLVDGKNATEINPASMKNGDKTYRLSLVTNTTGESIKAKKAVFRFYRGDGTEIDTAVKTVSSGNGIFTLDFNPATLGVTPGAYMTVQFVDQNGVNYYEHEMGFEFGEAIGILSFLSSFNFGGAEKAIEVIGVVDSAFNFGWDGDIDDNTDAVSTSEDGSVVTISVGFDYDSDDGDDDDDDDDDDDKDKSSKEKVKDAAKDGGTTKEKKKEQEEAAKSAVDEKAKDNKTKTKVGAEANVKLSFALEIQLIKDGPTKQVTQNGVTKTVKNPNSGKYYFGSMTLAATVEGGVDVTIKYVTPVGIPIKIVISVGASGAATFIVDQNYNKDIYYISQVTDFNTRKVDLFNFNMKNGDRAFDAYGIFNIAPYLDLSAAAGFDFLNLGVGGRADFDMTFYTRSDQKDNGEVKFTAYIQMKILFVKKKWNIASTTVNMFGDASGIQDMTKDVDYTHESLSTMGVDDRAYWNHASQWMGESDMMAQSVASTSGITENVLKNGVNPNPDIQMQALGNGKYLAVFLDDDTREDKRNCTHVYYTIGDGIKWSQPILIENDGTLDDAPSIFDLGEKGIYVTWSSADRKLTEEDTLIQSLNSMNIHGAFFDVATEKFGSIQEITTTSPYSYVDEDGDTICDDVADVTPHVSYDAATNRMIIFYNKIEYASSAEKDDQGLVGDIASAYTLIAYRIYDFTTGTWIATYDENEGLDADYTKAWYGQRFLELAPLASIVEETDSEGFWTKEPTIEKFVNKTYTNSEGAVVEQDPVVVEAQTATYNGLALLTYVLDYDGNKETEADRDVYMQIYNYSEDSFTHPIMLTNSPNVAESNLQVVKAGKSIELTYLAENTIYSIDLSNTVQGLLKTTIDGQPLYYIDKARKEATEENQYIYAKPNVIAGERISEETQTVQVEETEEKDNAITDYKVMSADNYVYYIWAKKQTTIKDGVEENSEEAMEAENRVSEAQLYICRYDIKEQHMTSPVQVTDEQGANYGMLDFVVDNNAVGNVEMLATKSGSKIETVQVDGKDVKILAPDEDNTSMVSVNFTPVSTLTVQNVGINDLYAGRESNAHMELYNDGLETLTDINVQITDEDGKEIYSDSIQVSEEEQSIGKLYGGDIYYIDFPVYLNEGEKECRFNYTVTDKSGKILAKNTYQEEIPTKLDVNYLEATTTQRGNIKFALEVTNNSNRALSGEEVTIAMKRDGVDSDFKTLTKVAVEDLQPGQSQYMEEEYTYEEYKKLFQTFIKEGEESLTAVTYFEASTQGEGTSATDEIEMTANKEQRLRMQAIQKVTVLDGNYKEIQGTYKLDKGDITQLNTAVESLAYAGSRYEGNDDEGNYDKTNTAGLKVMYASDNEKVVKVYDDGFVEAVGSGNATIKSYVMPANNKATYNSVDGTIVEDNYAILPQEAILVKEVQVNVGNATPAPTNTPIPTVKKLSETKISLAKTTYEWDGKTKRPKVTVKDALGQKLTENKDYTVSYSKGCKNAGTYNVVITGKGNYTGTVTKTFKIAVVKNHTYTVGSYVYKVSRTATNKKAGEAVVTKAKSKNVKSITVADTVKIGGATYKVTGITNGAFKNSQSATKATIGKNVKTIDANAFRGCAKLKKITIKSTGITKIGNNAIKGISAKAVIKVPVAKLTAYQKKLNAKTGYKSTMIIKK